MKPAHLTLTIDRVIVAANAATPDVGVLDALIQAEVRAALSDASLPACRTVKAQVSVTAAALDSMASIARAIGMGVAQAVSRGRAHG
ncbi:hypothetical protein [Paraburkholderia sp. BR14320]|uniref:hypothetical protein n=1 Tax=unclassified Paraburkholderia TaxID=2615204 RepID=UPI0034CD1F58